MNVYRADVPKTTLIHKYFKRYMRVYIYIYASVCVYHIYIFHIDASLQKSKFTLSMSKYILLYNH